MCRLIVNRCGRRDDRLHAINGIVERRGIDEGLEYRTWLAMRERVIELALSIIAAADDRLNLSRPRVKRDQGDLCLGDRLGTSLLGKLLTPLVVFLGQQQVHIL